MGLPDQATGHGELRGRRERPGPSRASSPSPHHPGARNPHGGPPSQPIEWHTPLHSPTRSVATHLPHRLWHGAWAHPSPVWAFALNLFAHETRLMGVSLTIRSYPRKTATQTVCEQLRAGGMPVRRTVGGAPCTRPWKSKVGFWRPTRTRS